MWKVNHAKDRANEYHSYRRDVKRFLFLRVGRELKSGTAVVAVSYRGEKQVESDRG